MPNGHQRAAITQRIEDLQQAARPGPWNRTLVVLGELVTEYASARLDEDTAAIKIDAYRDAVEDLPAWAVREAVRRWRRGDVSGDPEDLDFAPRPARLRRIAQSIAATAIGQALRLQRILEAEAEDTPRPKGALAYSGDPHPSVRKVVTSGFGIQPGSEADRERGAAQDDLAERLASSETQRKSEGVR